MTRLFETDVAIVGGGVAGLAAARTLTEHGVNCAVFEAADCLGGRVRTTRRPGWALPIELGAEFVHGRPAPTLALGSGSVPLELVPEKRIEAGPRFKRMTRTWKRFEKTMGPARDAEPTQSVLGYVLEQELNAEQRELVRMIVEGYHAAPLDDVSASSIGADAASAGADFEQYRVTTGYTSVLSLLEHGIVRERAHIELLARVRHIEWTPDSVNLKLELRSEPAQVRARKCLITASLGVLRAPAREGGIAISPLPSRISEGLSAIGMGHVVKVVLRFERPPWRHERALVESSFIHLPGGAFATFFHQSHADQEQVTAWAAGPAALALGRMNAGALCDTALRNLALAFAVEPGACQRALVEAHHHDFSNDPAFRGAYSYQRPGHGDARSAFAPVEDTLFFAGEALDLQYPATVAGAIGSGQHVARQIVASCRRRDREPGRKVG